MHTDAHLLCWTAACSLGAHGVELLSTQLRRITHKVMRSAAKESAVRMPCCEGFGRRTVCQLVEAEKGALWRSVCASLNNATVADISRDCPQTGALLLEPSGSCASMQISTAEPRGVDTCVDDLARCSRNDSETFGITALTGIGGAVLCGVLNGRPLSLASVVGMKELTITGEVSLAPNQSTLLHQG
ncbi:hypothetical protein CYMTET_14107 [Cymbomonas tetramitiformis]|uniref:Uncharacterized protein n=1 Tax=Cymbomonas tetramitiformis TaxID=36881 RepID=A0AAE0GH71_9CHLO|nr:hypothetical protein CYMTET_14107 [Cymbomonas tetramitiformis]